MKNETVIVFLLTICAFVSSHAQFRLPQISPEGEIRQRVGYTNFTISYGRPAARGRVIMDGLVPYGKLWRTGAGPATIISFDRDITLAGKRIVAGSYTLVTIPEETTWSIMLISDTSRLYVEDKDYDMRKEAVRFSVDATPFPVFESFTIIPDVVDVRLRLLMTWAGTAIQFELETFTEDQVEQMITEMNRAERNHENLGAAAHYYLVKRQHLERALKMIDEALMVKKDVWYFETRMNLLASQGRYTEAKATLDAAVQYLSESKPDYWQDHVNGLDAQAALWRSR